MEKENNSKIINPNMNIAYIVLCHIDPDFVAHTARTLQYENDGVFIHVDKKVDIEPFLQKCKGLTNIYFVSEDKRVKNYWGGFNSIIATFNTIELALKKGNYDRFVLLQGQDYPLFSNKYIHNFFAKHSETEFCKAQNISASKNKKEYMRVGGYWHTDNTNFLWKIIHKFNSLGLKYRPLKYKNKNAKWNIYHGWAQFALTRKCVEYCLNVFKTDMSYNKFMRRRFPPDELYFPTIIYNSPFVNNVDRTVKYNRHGTKTKLNLTYFEYPDKIIIFKDKNDYNWLKKTGCLYVRKINSSSKELIEEIDKRIE